MLLSCLDCKFRVGSKCRKLKEYVNLNDYCSNFKKSKDEDESKITCGNAILSDK